LNLSMRPSHSQRQIFHPSYRSHLRYWETSYQRHPVRATVTAHWLNSF
jgi:hypothetical protein